MKKLFHRYCSGGGDKEEKVAQLGTAPTLGRDIVEGFLSVVIPHVPHPPPVIFPPFFAHFFHHELAGLDGEGGQDSQMKGLGGRLRGITDR